MPAALEGAGGKSQGAAFQVWSANLYLHALKTLGLKPMTQAACNAFNKEMYQPGFAVYIALCNKGE